MELGGRSIVWQRLVREVVGGYDAVVLGAFVRFASSHALRAAFAARGRPVVYRGDGVDTADEVGKWPAPVVRRRQELKLRLARSVDAYLAYTGGTAAVNAGRERPVECALIGAGPELDRIRALAADTRGVKVLGALDDRAVARWLACATAVAVPGRRAALAGRGARAAGTRVATPR